MATAEERLRELGLVLPEVPTPPHGTRISMRFARRCGSLLYLSGNGPIRNGELLYRGKVGRDVTIEQAYEAAKVVGLNLLAVIKAELGDLERVAFFVKTLGFVNSAPGFTELPAVINGFTDLIVDLYGEERGLHARSAIGVAELPWNIPVEIETIVQVDD